KPQAVRHLEAIVAAADGVMVARGDLGVELDVQRVPAVQKRAIALCNNLHRPVITATQMLNSMEHSSRPTRAEASDVFNRGLGGTRPGHRDRVGEVAPERPAGPARGAPARAGARPGQEPGRAGPPGELKPRRTLHERRTTLATVSALPLPRLRARPDARRE